jgi:hypothetical protein
MMQPPKTPILPHWPLYKSAVNFGTIDRAFCCITFEAGPGVEFAPEAGEVPEAAAVPDVDIPAAAELCPEVDDPEFEPKIKNK